MGSKTALQSPLRVSQTAGVPVEVKGNKMENRGLILHSSMLGDSIPCMKSHLVLPTAQGAVGPAISTDAALIELGIARLFTQEPH